MIEIQPFRFAGYEVRTVVIDGEPWFVGSDVATLLGYARPNDAVREIVPENHRGSTVIQRGTSGGNPNMTVIDESGVWRLIMRSNAPHAEEVQEWVTGTVLPSIRKTGGYGTVAVPETREQRFALALQEAGGVIAEMNERLAIAAPKVKLADDFLNTDGLISLIKAKRDLREAGLGWHDLIKANGCGLLQRLGWVTERRREASADGLDNGYVAMVPTGEYRNPWGEMVTNYTVMLTRKGFAWLAAYLRQDRPAISA